MNRDDPLSEKEREEYERDLIRFSDRELDLLGDISGKNVLYAGGTSPLWIEGLAERIGASGSLTVLDLDSDGLKDARDFFDPEDLPLSPEYVVGDVFDLPFGSGIFDFVYSSGLLHELDVRDWNVCDALSEMRRVVRPGGAVVASDFVSDADSAQVEEESINAEAARLATGAELFGVHPAEWFGENLSADSTDFGDVDVEVHPPLEIRHLDKLFLAQPAPDSPDLRRKWRRLRESVEREGYSRPATMILRFPAG